MSKDPIHGAEIEGCEICSTPEAEPCRCGGKGHKASPGKSAGNLIDFRQRASELRVKGALTGKVSSFEASRALAFGLMYLNGEGVGRDPVQAAHFLKIASQGGLAQARYELARLHVEGLGVPYDPEGALRLLQSACDDGHVASMIYLAELYIFDTHCVKDIDAALELLYVAAAQDEPAAMYYLAFVYDKDPDYQNAFEAAYWYRRAAEYGHFKSQVRLAALYATGQGVPASQETAEAFLEVALEATAQQDPRFLLWQGERFVARPETQFLAHALIKAAADLQHAPAQRLLLQHGWRA